MQRLEGQGRDRLTGRTALQAVIDGLSANVAVLDAAGTITAVNASWTRFAAENGDPGDARTGRGANYLRACRVDDLGDRELAERAAAGIGAVLRHEELTFSLEYPCHSPDVERWFVLLVAPFGDSGAVVAHVDVTADHLTRNHPLSGIPSRALAEGQVEAAIASAQPAGGEVSVLYVDVDDFKEVNDTLGHDVGDALLEAVQARLVAVVPPGCDVRRFASDEFVAVVPGSTRSRAGELAGAIGEAMRRPFDLGPDRIMSTVSIGVARYPSDAVSARELVQCADAAMSEGKRAGRDTWRHFDGGVGARRRRRLDVSRGLRRALAAQQFELHYQPQVALADGQVVGVEALLRWHCPALGDPSPAEFVPIAESTGRILPIGWWAMARAIAQMVRWRDEGLSPGVLAVNVSIGHFSQPGFADGVVELLSDVGWPPELLELEITEHMAIRQRDLSISVMEDLRAVGVRFALDDFGSGYSSLANLQAFPLHTAKIDRSFIAALGHGERAGALVAAMVGLIGSLGLECVAEGVQTQDQADFLSAARCPTVQGFRFARPMPPVALASWVRARS